MQRRRVESAKPKSAVMSTGRNEHQTTTMTTNLSGSNVDQRRLQSLQKDRAGGEFGVTSPNFHSSRIIEEKSRSQVSSDGGDGGL